MKDLIKTDKMINVIIYIESAKAFLNLVDICQVTESVSKNSKFQHVGLVFGSDDFCANIGASRTERSLEILYARQKLVLVAKAFNLQAIDMVYIKYKGTYKNNGNAFLLVKLITDLDGLKQQCQEGMKMGYTGKQVIHPGQVPIVQEAFLPTESQIEWATGLLKSFHKHQQDGKVSSALYLIIIFSFAILCL